MLKKIGVFILGWAYFVLAWLFFRSSKVDIVVAFLIIPMLLICLLQKHWKTLCAGFLLGILTPEPMLLLWYLYFQNFYMGPDDIVL